MAMHSPRLETPFGRLSLVFAALVVATVCAAPARAGKDEKSKSGDKGKSASSQSKSKGKDKDDKDKDDKDKGDKRKHRRHPRTVILLDPYSSGYSIFGDHRDYGDSPYRSDNYYPYRDYSAYPHSGYAPQTGGTNDSYRPRSTNISRGGSRGGSGLNYAGGPTPNTTNDPRARSGRGWQLLAEGRLSQAYESFENQAKAAPGRAGPLIGCAIAASATGNLTRGIRAMRDATEADVAAFDQLALDESVKSLVRNLPYRFESPPGGSSTRDVAFMSAACHAILGEATSARADIDRAVEAGDRSTATLRLRRHIYEKLGETPAEIAESSAPMPSESLR